MHIHIKITIICNVNRTYNIVNISCTILSDNLNVSGGKKGRNFTISSVCSPLASTALTANTLELAWTPHVFCKKPLTQHNLTMSQSASCDVTERSALSALKCPL